MQLLLLVPALLGMLTLSVKRCLWLPKKGSKIPGQVSGELGGEAAQRGRVLPFPAVLFLEDLTFFLGRHRETVPRQHRHHWQLWKLLPVLVGLSRNRIYQG